MTPHSEQCAWCHGFIVDKPEVEPVTAERGRETFHFHPERHCKQNWLEQEGRINRAFNGTL